LNIGFNRFLEQKSTYDVLAKLPKLKDLSMAGSEMAILEGGIGKLKNIVRLDISDNEFSGLPDSLFLLKDLKELNLADCNLTRLSPLINQLQKLEMLDLRYNTKLTYLPETIKELKNLKVLYLHNVALPPSERACVEEWLPHVKVYY
jgi:internalin A